ncbi:MAG TPA: ClC family H(+)/Cl(-) exchange transporter, partial [Candidatus Xenobia bacterium]
MSEKTVPPKADAETRQILAEETASYSAARVRRRRLVPKAALVGAGAGLVGVLFRWSLEWAELARDWMVVHAPGFIPLLVVGCMVSVWLVRRFAPEASGSGIPHLKAVMYGVRELVGQRVLPVKFLGGVLGIGAGMALGREGPTTQMGGSVGQMLAERMGVNTQERLTLIAAGAGAGLTAAFNAPIAGTVFVLEEIQRDFTPGVFVATMVATVIADMVTRVLSGQVAVIPINIYPTPPLASVVPFLVLGAMAGVLGVAYNRGLEFCVDRFPRLGRYGAVLVGVVVALSAWKAPELVGGGHHVLNEVFVAPMGAGMLIGVWVFRYVLTMISYGCGAPGGIFAPLLVLGSLLGLGVGQATHWLVPGLQVDPPVYAVVGMA